MVSFFCYSILNDDTSNINVYVGEDGQIHFTDVTGADSVLPFSSGSGGNYTSSDFIVALQTGSYNGTYTCPVKGLYLVDTNIVASTGNGYTHSVTSTGTILKTAQKYSNPGYQYYNRLSIIIADENDTITIKCSATYASTFLVYVATYYILIYLLMI